MSLANVPDGFEGQVQRLVELVLQGRDDAQQWWLLVGLLASRSGGVPKSMRVRLAGRSLARLKLWKELEAFLQRNAQGDVARRLRVLLSNRRTLC